MNLIKKSVNGFVLMNKVTNEYYDGEGYCDKNLAYAKKYNSLRTASDNLKYVDNPDEWAVLEVKITCELIEEEANKDDNRNLS